MASTMPFTCSGFGVADAPITMAQAFRSAGYHTRGFNAANPYVSGLFGYDRGFDKVTDFMEYFPARHALFRYLAPDDRVGANAAQRARTGPTLLGRLRGRIRRTRGLGRLAGWAGAATRHMDEGVRLRANLRLKRALEQAFHSGVESWLGAAGDGPFFLWVHVMTPHVPFAPPRRCQSAVCGRAMSTRRINRLTRKAAMSNRGDDVDITGEDVAGLVDLYDAEVRRADELVGKIMAALREHGLLDRSIVAVTADHGEQFMEHGRLVHPSCHYNEVLRVPLIVRLPGGEGERVAESVSLLGLLPTLADLAGVPLPDGACMGHSFASPSAGYCVSESFYGPNDTLAGIDWHALRRVPRRVSFQAERLKIMVDCATGECSAFDLREDPAEQRDMVPHSAECGEVALGMARLHVRRSERVRVRRLAARRPGLAGTPAGEGEA